MIPVKLGEISWHQQHFNKDSNEGELRAKLDLIRKVREEACVRATTPSKEQHDITTPRSVNEHSEIAI